MPVINQSLRILEPGHDLPRPYLDVVYINPHTSKHFKAIALIDTGADHLLYRPRTLNTPHHETHSAHHPDHSANLKTFQT